MVSGAMRRCCSARRPTKPHHQNREAYVADRGAVPRCCPSLRVLGLLTELGPVMLPRSGHEECGKDGRAPIVRPAGRHFPASFIYRVVVVFPGEAVQAFGSPFRDGGISHPW